MCADYSPTIVTEKEIRNFFTPPLDDNDITKADLLLKIETVEKYVSKVYRVTSSDAKIPCLLLIAAKIIHNPVLAQKHFVLKKEVLGDYSYEIADLSKTSSNPYSISKSWENMALEILDSLGTDRYTIYKAND